METYEEERERKREEYDEAKEKREQAFQQHQREKMLEQTFLTTLCSIIIANPTSTIVFLSGLMTCLTPCVLNFVNYLKVFLHF